MISLQAISKHYGRQAVLADASFQLNPGNKVGLVGPNGAGKSTIFRLLTGEEQPDRGEIRVPKNLTLGYFRQDAGEPSEETVLDAAIRGCGRLGELHEEVRTLEAAMEDPEQMDRMDEILERYGEVQGEYQQRGGYELDARAREVLHGLGFDDASMEGTMAAISGGWRMRVSIAQVLIGNPDVLLLDEPTNHLDIESILWLEEYLKASSSAILMTSHDRDFMDRIVTHIVEIDEGSLITHTGNYRAYEAASAQRTAQSEAAFARQQSMLKREERFIERFEKNAGKAAQVQSRVKKLDKIDKVEPPRRRRVLSFDFRPAP
ncbi:MAG: ABC-F family ATP-binding cassette domain-containing protein, partial [Planctomycetes bacterium]|nr:ABC-F family ATP-binding cassette domain-containing protein [Planctomycetota bacterium]